MGVRLWPGAVAAGQLVKTPAPPAFPRKVVLSDRSWAAIAVLVPSGTDRNAETVLRPFPGLEAYRLDRGLSRNHYNLLASSALT